MISVCMATYNGKDFVIRQLDSILAQLSDDDQVIVVDDVSSDGTADLIRATYGDRIELYQNETNLRSMKSFERALSYVRGEYVFLADQDDIWFENKVSRVLQAFKEEQADLVVHDAVVVDGDLNLLDQSWNARNGNRLNQGQWGNLLKNAFTGCMMAFRSSLIPAFVPLPATIEMHDQWIALVALKEHKKLAIIEEPLMQYVRHGGNVTAIKKRTLGEQLKGRLGTLKAIQNYQRNEDVKR